MAITNNQLKAPCLRFFVGDSGLMLCFVICFFVCSVLVRAESERPNILLIAIDDLNDWVGCLDGHPDTETPNIDRLASEGILFANAHAPAPACNPSRTAILTGVLPYRSGIRENMQPFRLNQGLKHIRTLPQVFKDNGYFVAGAGKIFHVNFPDPESWDDYWPSKEITVPELWEGAGDLAARFDSPVLGLPKPFRWGNVQSIEANSVGDWKVAEWVADLLEKGHPHKKNWFISCGFLWPHLPWLYPNHPDGNFEAEELQLPEILDGDLSDLGDRAKRLALSQREHEKIVNEGEWKNAVCAYLECIRFVDACVGKVIRALENSGHGENTIVVLFSDHGFHLGEKSHWSKFTLWEESTRVPMIWRVPPKFSGISRKVEESVGLIDIFPTLIDICGIQGPEHDIDGASLRPFLTDPEKGEDRAVIVTGKGGDFAVIKGNHKLIQYKNGGREFYDRKNDPNEFFNISRNVDMRKKYAEAIGNLRAHVPEKWEPDSPRDPAFVGIKEERSENRKKPKEFE